MNAKTSIAEELVLSSKYELEFSDKNILTLTTDNVARVEAMIRNDSDYVRSSDRNAAPIPYPKKQTTENVYKYGGSTAYWMLRLKELLTKQPIINNYTEEEILRQAVSAVDRENSTHLNVNNGRGKMVGTIKSKLNELYDRLKKRDFGLIEELRNKEINGRDNYSFATKFCHYACFYLFDGTDEQDNFSIYDGILANALPHYAEFYGIKMGNYDLRDYETYSNLIDEIREKSEKTISRNGFDHLLWYYHKAHPFAKK